jgi:PAS domain S-box-containing protein
VADLQLVRDFSAAAGLVIQHVRYRDSLAESEQRFRLLAEAASEGVAIHEDGRILIASRSLAKMFGYEPEELVGMDVVKFAEPELRKEVAETMRQGKRIRRIAQSFRKDGSRFWVDVKGEGAVFQGRPVRLLAIRDVTEEKLLEETRERLLNQERVAREQAETAIRVRDEFLAIASHELRTPLTPLKIELQLLRMSMRQVLSDSSPRTALLLKALDHGEGELDRLGRLITDLLDVTRISAGRLQLKRERCDLAKIVQTVIERFSSQVREEGCEIRTDLPPALSGTWDPARLDQVVTNLITNALKYGRGSPILVSLREAGGMARLSVRDEGIGIAPADQKRIFERFVRVAPVENYGGLGLGLFVARQLVTAHGGTIEVESELGKGASFTVLLPISAVPDA